MKIGNIFPIVVFEGYMSFLVIYFSYKMSSDNIEYFISRLVSSYIGFTFLCFLKKLNIIFELDLKVYY